jgi:hypothetical protein
MTPVVWMVIVSVGTALAAAAAVGGDVRVEIVLGMLAPLAAVVVTWLVVERGHRRNPLLVTAILLKAFAAKVVFFLVYVTVMIAGVGLQAQPFIISLTAYFIALYAAEAWFLHRLFLRQMAPAH